MSANPRTTSDVLVDILIEKGVEYIFGHPGGAAIPIYDALVGRKIELVLTRHEQGAVHMADGYARASGKTGVVLVTSGPGATNTITGLLTAYMDSVPIIVITGQTTTWNLGLDAFQEADVSGISYPVVKHSYLVKKASDLPRVLREAFFIAGSGRPGPVLIDLPKDISSAVLTSAPDQEFHLPGYSPSSETDEEAVRQAAEMIGFAKRPLLLVGHGSIIAGASEEVRKLAIDLQIPVVNTLLGKGCFSESHELSLGMLGMHGTGYANRAMVESDLIINIGSRFDDRIVGRYDDFCRNAKKIHFDIDASELNKVVQVDIAVKGDAKKSLSSLLYHFTQGTQAPDTTAWVKQVKRWRREMPLHYKKEGKLRAQHVMNEMYKLTQGKAIITTDVGQHQMWAAQFFPTEKPRDWLSSGGAGTMGFGFPSAIGAQLARKNELVIAVVGDGGFQMTLCELSTAFNLKIPVKILVINNHYLGMVRQWQNMFYEDRLSGVDLEGSPDFVKLAEAYGIKAFRIRRSADVRKVLKAALDYKAGPCLIDAEVEKHDNVFPMIPAGASLSQILLEAPKRKLDKPTGST